MLEGLVRCERDEVCDCERVIDHEDVKLGDADRELERDVTCDRLCVNVALDVEVYDRDRVCESVTLDEGV